MRASHARLAALAVVIAFAAFAPPRIASADGPVPAQEIRLGLFGACMPSDQVGWVVGDLGRVYRTADGGKTWARQEMVGRRPVFSISCVDDQHAWVSSTSGAIYATADGGSTWKLQQTPSKRNLFKVAFTTLQNGAAVGDFGTMVHTADGGATWSEIPLPADFKLPPAADDQGVMPNDALLYGLTFVDDKNGWLCGEWGTILKTEDGGATWKQQVSGVESTLFGIAMRDAQNGTAVGIDSVILRTEDGGTTWKPVQSPFQDRAFYEVAFSGQNGWLAGNQGLVMQSTDGGASWKQVQTPKEVWSEWFRGIGLRGDRGLLVGGSGKIYEIKGTEAVLLNPGSGNPHDAEGHGHS
ncbi:MAG: WD40/YVTN/BNR-like repeat-containing protein [Alphaproteobacteria bacterium]